ncbi:MAG: hypothetical protein H9535_12835 [Ignavibacteria bacterium]|nr:hypothetical protein [Ignavibacteria bacterium]
MAGEGFGGEVREEHWQIASQEIVKKMHVPKKSLPEHGSGQLFFLVALRRKKLSKIDVATTIVTGFSLHPTLALPFWILYITDKLIFYFQRLPMRLFLKSNSSKQI